MTRDTTHINIKELNVISCNTGQISTYDLFFSFFFLFTNFSSFLHIIRLLWRGKDSFNLTNLGASLYMR